MAVILARQKLLDKKINYQRGVEDFDFGHFFLSEKGTRCFVRRKLKSNQESARRSKKVSHQSSRIEQENGRTNKLGLEPLGSKIDHVTNWTILTRDARLKKYKSSMAPFFSTSPPSTLLLLLLTLTPGETPHSVCREGGKGTETLNRTTLQPMHAMRGKEK